MQILCHWRAYADAGFTSLSSLLQSLRKTPLHAVHVKLGAKMAPFCGWDMPIEYPDGTLNSHMWTRQKAGLFDVSHMGQVMYAPSFLGADGVADRSVPASAVPTV